MDCKYIITKRSPGADRVYLVHIQSDIELAEHISACFEFTSEEIIAVIRVTK